MGLVLQLLGLKKRGGGERGGIAYGHHVRASSLSVTAVFGGQLRRPLAAVTSDDEDLRLVG